MRRVRRRFRTDDPAIVGEPVPRGNADLQRCIGGPGLVSVDGLRLQWSSPGGTFPMKNGLYVEFTAGDAPGYYSISASDVKVSGSAGVTIW